jgi:hypothetical protein
VFILHDEVKDIATDTATEAMKDLLRAGDGKRGGLFRVEGAERFVVAAATLQRKVFSDHIDDVVAPTNLFNKVLRDVFSHARSLYLSKYTGMDLDATRGVPAPTKGFSQP